MDEKACTKCKVMYPVEHFSKKGSGRGTRCRSCVAEYYREYYHGSESRKTYVKSATKRNKEKNKEKILSKRYNITEQQVSEVLNRNGGMCQICQVKKGTAIDHCHDTGQVRGLLCGTCNLGIGQLGDNLEGIMRAVQYLSGVSPLSDKESKG